MSSIVTVVASISSLAYWLGRKFTKIDERFKAIDERFKDIDKKFEIIDKRFEMIDKRFEQIDERFKQIDRRFEQIDKRFEEMDGRFKEMNRRFTSMEAKMTREIRRLGALFITYQDFLIDFLSLEGVIRSDRADFLKAEARRLFKLAFTSLTKEEWKRLAELLDKDKYTPEEAEELLELAKKARDKYWDREEAWRLYIFARIVYVETHYKKSKD